MRAGHPTYHVNVIKLKWEIMWTGGLPTKAVTSPTWGPPHPCKQALTGYHLNNYGFKQKEIEWKTIRGGDHSNKTFLKEEKLCAKLISIQTVGNTTKLNENKNNCSKHKKRV